MVGKNGVLRVLETTIAILIISSVVIFFSVRTQNENDLHLDKIAPPLLEEISKNTSLRDIVISSNQENKKNNEKIIIDFISPKIKIGGINYTVKICELNDICVIDTPIDSFDDIYVSERVISATPLVGFNPKIVKIFLWRSKPKP